MTASYRAKLCVLIVTFGKPADVNRCLKSLGRSTWKDFEVFVCENAGQGAYAQLVSALNEQEGVLESIDDHLERLDRPGGRLVMVRKFRLRGTSITVRLGAAVENLGYAGGVNAWLERFLDDLGWEALLVLNPDTEVDERCLSELMAKTAEDFGMVGGSLVFDSAPGRIINYGLIWSATTGRTIAVGRNSAVGSSPSSRLLARIDSISGACVLVTRAFVNDVGLMSEDFFLYMEDLDWGRRRGHHRIGFARKAIVRHVGGTTIGSAVDPKARSPLSIYLCARNNILYARRTLGFWWVFHFVIGLADALRHFLGGSPRAAQIVLAGLIDGAKGRMGRPDIVLPSQIT